MSNEPENESVLHALNDDWKSLTIEELKKAAFMAVQEYSWKVKGKLEEIIGDDSIDIMGQIWSALNVKPMDFVKRADPEIIAIGLMDCTAKETATVIRFIDDYIKREKVLKILSGEIGWDWREAERHIEKNIADLAADVPDTERTEALYLAAVKKNGQALQCIPEAMKTETLCLAAVQQDGEALKYVPEALKTEALCLTAVKQCAPAALHYIPEALTTEDFYKKAANLFSGPILDETKEKE
jgi:predicted transcriptional regulator